MLEFGCLDDMRSFDSPTVAAIGFFDGVHRAHQSIIQICRERAKQRGVQSAVFTFQNHPATVLGDAEKRGEESTFPLLTPYPLKRDRMRSLGVDVIAGIPFSKELSETPPCEFINGILKAKLNAVEIVVGFNFHFGYQRQGSPMTLANAVPERFEHVTVVEQQHWNDKPISSTAIRQAIQAGNLALAEELLGYPYQLSGMVAKGDGRGRTIGFPTANIETKEHLLPPHGVYGVKAHIGELDGEAHWGVMNIGQAPTFGGKPAPSVEVHLLNHQGDLYGERLIVDVVCFLREERKFSGVDELTAAINNDISHFKKHISANH